MRLNYEGHGQFLGEFQGEDMVLVVLENGEFYITNFDLNNHYEQNILRIEKFNPEKVWTAVLWDADNQNLPYIKRFSMEASSRHQNFLGDNPESSLIFLTDTQYPRLELTFMEPDTFRGPTELDVDEFIAVKGFKAKGKRLTAYALDEVTEIISEEDNNTDDNTDNNADDNADSNAEDNVDNNAEDNAKVNSDGNADDSGESGKSETPDDSDDGPDDEPPHYHPETPIQLTLF